MDTRDDLCVHIRVLNVCELGLSGFLLHGKVLRNTMRHMVLPVKVTSFSGEQKSEGTRFAPRAILSQFVTEVVLIA